MSKVYKKEGKFHLEPDPLLVLRARSKTDRARLKNTLSDAELRQLLEQMLTRLEALERRSQ